jgi:hypothetical protein
MRHLGCLGCLSLGGLLTVLFPLILIGGLIYWLVSRRPAGVPPPPAAGQFCPQCGKPMGAAEKFCANCGNRVL